MTAQIRKWYYLIGALVTALVPILVTSGVVSDTQGNAWINAVVAIGGVLGAAGLGTAGVVLGKQIKGAPGAAADKAVTSLQDIQAQLNSTAQAAQDQLAAATQVAVDSITKIQATVGNVVGPQVSLGPLAAEVIKSVTE
ncbi:hypothetical protein [Mycobacteroides abscessus]|uniref:Holin n=2 Tax=Mycobacteroides abscessus TaxID=36809 RepID=B1MNI9_MYCA9|nr:hypothetical protein [Mycobacteroides abscessus]OHU67387.1 hypothetical protein BKG87_22070 [Mycobacteroides chelonae]QPO17487.1 holin [Mycobacterium phage phiGD23-1]QPO17607.1 holin [Mycobacterium phage phiGD22-1]QPO17791.1 holin [Mycobacterium phage phiGD20-1]QSM01771.1 holin [Mycobacterium phage prophiGD11-1]QSM02156.1 holin [Mycobacterium phage prophiGD20-1]QSM02515.1 holin [Mycobacterium phage prophiGD17-2]QSM02626.1 holin [Mycobacterium phage prophiGD57-2]QSM03101.1 holin [Mycobac